MRNLLLAVVVTLAAFTIKAQFQVEHAQQPTYNPSELLQRYNTTPYTPPTYVPPVYIPTESAEKKIRLVNKTREVKEVRLYTMNLGNYQWEYLQTIRIPGGGEFSHIIGRYEQLNDYGYKIVGSYSDLINKFSIYPVSLW